MVSATPLPIRANPMAAAMAVPLAPGCSRRRLIASPAPERKARFANQGRDTRLAGTSSSITAWSSHTIVNPARRTFWK